MCTFCSSSVMGKEFCFGVFYASPWTRTTRGLRLTRFRRGSIPFRSVSTKMQNGDGFRQGLSLKDRPWKVDWSVYLVTDRAAARGRDVDEIVEAAITGGVSVVQLRDKHVSTRDMLTLGTALVEITKRRQIPLFVNDRVDVALAIEADGVHVGQDDMPAKLARKIIGDKMLLGVSAGTLEEAQQAEADGADYIGVGAVFSTTSKADAGDAIGTDTLQRITDSVHIPVVAIGGINADNAKSCAQTGIAGIAVISDIMGADDPAAAAAGLQSIMALRNH